MFRTTTSLRKGTGSSLRATNLSPASMRSWFKRGNAVSANDDGGVPNDAGVVPSDDSVPWRNAGDPVRLPGPVMRPDAGAATGASADGSFGRRPGCPAAAAETGGHGFLERIESGALADGLGERIALEGGDQDVAPRAISVSSAFLVNCHRRLKRGCSRSQVARSRCASARS